MVKQALWLGAASPDRVPDLGWAGNANPLITWLKGGELAEGKSVSGGSTEAQDLLGSLSGIDWPNAKVSVTSRGKSGNTLSLDVSAQLRLTSGQTYFDLDLKGPAKIDLEKGWVSELSLSGDVKAGGHLKHKKGVLNVSGKGTAKLARKISE